MKKMLVMMFMLTLSIVGCSTSQSNSDLHEPTLGLSPVESGYGTNVSDTFGDVSEIQEAPPMIDQANMITAEYNGPTNRWFNLSVDDQPLVLSYSAGIRKPGEVVNISLSRLPEERYVRFQLTSRNEELQRYALIKEQITSTSTDPDTKPSFNIKLPESEHTLYYISAEIMNSSDEVEDTFLTSVTVPMQQLNAKLSVNPAELNYGLIPLTLYNAGPTVLEFGADYRFEALVEGTWRLYVLDMAFNSMMYHLQPDMEFTVDIDITMLPVGHYRVIKEVGASGTTMKTVLGAEFDRK